MKLGIAGSMGAIQGDEDIISSVGEGVISEVRMRSIISQPTIDDSELDVGEHDDDCEGCPLCKKARPRRSRARRVSKVPHLREII